MTEGWVPTQKRPPNPGGLWQLQDPCPFIHGEWTVSEKTEILYTEIGSSQVTAEVAVFFLPLPVLVFGALWTTQPPAAEEGLFYPCTGCAGIRWLPSSLLWVYFLVAFFHKCWWTPLGPHRRPGASRGGRWGGWLLRNVLICPWMNSPKLSWENLSSLHVVI